MPSKNLICVVVDRLHAGMMGAYGNGWIKTRALDRLACESFVFDQAIIDSTQLDRLYQAYWLGQAAAWATEPAGAGTPFVQLLRAAGMHTALMTDEPAVAELPAASDFAELRRIVPPNAPRTAGEAGQTALARLFAAALAWLSTAPRPFCLWIHARGMAGGWDAPLELRNQYATEDDPEPPRLVQVPERWLADDYDPDELLGITHAYAGQIALLDQCTTTLLDFLSAGDLAATTQLTLLSARGFPLGEHRRVGPCDEALYNETVQIPWLMRFPDGLGKLARSQALVLPADLPGTLLDWLDIERGQLGAGHASSLLDIVRGQTDALRDHVLLTSRHERAIRTPAWHLRLPDQGAAELYAKPSDRWEVSEVANLMPDVVAGLQAAVTAAEQSGPHGAAAPLAERLVQEIDESDRRIAGGAAS